VALAAGFRAGTRRAAAAVAITAGFHFFHVNFSGNAKGGIVKTQRQIVTQISPALNAGSGASAPAAKAEQILENTAKA
jgi:hypothetical protein